MWLRVSERVGKYRPVTNCVCCDPNQAFFFTLHRNYNYKFQIESTIAIHWFNNTRFSMLHYNLSEHTHFIWMRFKQCPRETEMKKAKREIQNKNQKRTQISEWAQSNKRTAFVEDTKLTDRCEWEKCFDYKILLTTKNDIPFRLFFSHFILYCLEQRMYTVRIERSAFRLTVSVFACLLCTYSSMYIQQQHEGLHSFTHNSWRIALNVPCALLRISVCMWWTLAKRQNQRYCVFVALPMLLGYLTTDSLVRSSNIDYHTSLQHKFFNRNMIFALILL